MERIEKFIGVHFKVGACNLRCSYCYLSKHKNNIKDIPYSLEVMRKAFSKKRLGGICFINICSDGETLMHPMMPEIIKMFLAEGHYVMILTNATLTKRLKECIESNPYADRLFFKVSFHYEELKRLGTLDVFFNNLEMIKESPCSYTVEYITCDETLEDVEQFKKLCMDKMGALPQINIPRDERACNLRAISKGTWDKYILDWEKCGFKSEFFDFRKQLFGKKYKGFCHAGYRSIWVDMENGFSYQCYHLPPLQNFMGEIDKPIKWLAVGNNCPEAHCYVAHSHITLGAVDYPSYVNYRPTYDVIRNRKCLDGTEWVKPTYKAAFQAGVNKDEAFSGTKKKIINRLNRLLRWKRRQKLL